MHLEIDVTDSKSLLRCSTVGAFTKNIVAAAPVLYCRDALLKTKTVRALLSCCHDYFESYWYKAHAGHIKYTFIWLSIRLNSFLLTLQARAVLINAGQANAATVSYVMII